MNYDFLICGLRVRFLLPWQLKLTGESLPFLVTPEASGKPDFEMRFVAVDDLKLPAEGVWSINSFFSARGEERCVWHSPIQNDPPYCCVVWNKASANIAICQYLKDKEDQIIYTRNLLELVGLEALLLRFDALILHAAVVEFRGQGILFCAPSGTGKSTQAALWAQHMGSRTLNGDRAGIRCERGIWKAWGLPIAGTSGIYCNESVPIKAVVLLRQGSQNRITPVNPLNAFKRMLPECSAQRWDAGFMDRLMGVLAALSSAVSVYQLECRPDYEAVQLLCDTILKEG